MPQSEQEKEKVKLKVNMKEVDVTVYSPSFHPYKEDREDGGESYCLLGAHASSLQREKGNAFFM